MLRLLTKIPIQSAETSSGQTPRRAPTEADWLGSVCTFLEQHPAATLLSVMQHLWPDYYKLSEGERIEKWYWIQSEFEYLSHSGLLECQQGEDGVSTWSLHGHELSSASSPAPAKRASG